MPTLFGVEVSDDVYAANKHLAAPPKEGKTAARQRLEAEQRRNFAMQFEAVWRTLGGPALTPEFRFCEWRKWPADYYCETATGKWLIELEGGVWTGGRHTRGKGFIEDCVKYNTATLLGYRVIRIPTGFATVQYLQQIVDSLGHVPATQP